MISWMVLRTFIFDKRGLSLVGVTRLLKKTYTIFFAGSAQVQVPVKPVCPKLREEAAKHG